VQSSQGLLKHSFAGKCCATITHLLTRQGSQHEREEEGDLLNPATPAKKKQKAGVATSCTELV